MEAEGTEENLTERVERLERTVSELRRELDAARPRRPEPIPARVHEPAEAPPRHSRRKRPVTPGIRLRWDGEFWLNKLGIGLFLLGVALLFRYSIDQGWLTPTVRVGFGAALGCVLFGAGLRLEGSERRFVSVLLGGGIAVFYIVGFAAFYLYALIPYIPAFAAMVAITLLAFTLALHKEEPVLAVLGAAGGLGTPLILGVSHGSPRAFALYTCFILFWTCALFWRRGWNALLWTSFAGGWLLLVIYALRPFDPARALLADQLALQGAAIFAWVAFGIVPLARRIVEPGSEGESATVFLDLEDDASMESLHWHALALLSPLLGLAVTALVWAPTPAEWGAVAAALAVAYAAVGWALRARHAESSELVLLTASVLLPAGTVAGLEGDSLLLALAAEGVALHWIARSTDDSLLRAMAYKVFAAAAIWSLVRIFDGDVAATLRSGVDLAVLGCALVMASRAPSPFEAVALRLFAHVALLGWLWRELHPIAGGEGYVSVAWGAYGVALLVHATRRARPLLERIAIGTLLVVTAKLFLVDLAALEAIWRVLLFLGIGSGFLFLSYALQTWWRPGSAGPPRQEGA